MTENEPMIRFRIDDISWNDLDMDAVFDRINSSRTSAGDDYLKYILKNIPLSRDKDDMGHITDRLSEDTELKTKAGKTDYVAGANIAGFIKVANAMIAQGLV